MANKHLASLYDCFIFFPEVLISLLFQKAPEQSNGYSASLWHSGGMLSPPVDDCEA